MFLDASAIVAMLADEDERLDLLSKLAAESDPLTSAVAVFEATLAIARRKGFAVNEASAVIENFLALSKVRLVPIGLDEQRAALDAQSRFGKGRGHPAQLNLGDCFAYACARTNGRSLLYKGNDFTHTDIERA